MSRIYFLFLSCAFLCSCTSSQTLIELTAAQSMCITGKGPGQDAAINPYSSGNSLGIVKNVGEDRLQARIQKDGKIISLTDVAPGQTESLVLLEGQELYLDGTRDSRAKIRFKAWRQDRE